VPILVLVTRLKRKDQRTGFRQSACDRSTILASAARPTRSTGTDASVTIRLLILTPGQRVNRIRAETDVRKERRNSFRQCRS